MLWQASHLRHSVVVDHCPAYAQAFGRPCKMLHPSDRTWSSFHDNNRYLTLPYCIHMYYVIRGRLADCPTVVKV